MEEAMSKKRRNLSAELKSRVALEAVREGRTVNAIAGEYGVHPNQVREWKKQLLKGCPGLFESGRASPSASDEALTGRLYEEIGRLKVELDWLQRKVCL
jgi:putative transposase